MKFRSPLTYERMVRHGALRNVSKDLEQLSRNAISFEERKLIPSEVQPFTKFGGMPDLPPAFDWPTYKIEIEGEPSKEFLQCSEGTLRIAPSDGIQSIPFVCQISCEELATFDEDNVFPDTGFIYIFDGFEWFDIDIASFDEIPEFSDDRLNSGEGSFTAFGEGPYFQIRSFHPSHEDTYAVLYWSGDRQELSPRSTPENVAWQKDHPNGYREVFLELRSERTLPRGEDGNIDEENDWSDAILRMPRRTYERYQDLFYRWRANRPINQFLGFPDRFCGGVANPPDLTLGSVRSDAVDRILLMQISAEFQDSIGMLATRDEYFLMRKKDLMEKDFEKVWRSCS